MNPALLAWLVARFTECVRPRWLHQLIRVSVADNNRNPHLGFVRPTLAQKGYKVSSTTTLAKSFDCHVLRWYLCGMGQPYSSTTPRRRYRRRRAYRAPWTRSRRRHRSTSRPYPYEERAALLSRGEAAFFGPLCLAVAGRFHVMCKVRLADVLTCSDANWRRGFGGAISQKHLDFVLCERGTMRFILAIELDDRSHERPERQRRDRFLNDTFARSRIRLLRFRAQAYYSAHEIRDRIDGVLPGTELAPRVQNMHYSLASSGPLPEDARSK